MGRRASITNILRNMGYTVEGNGIVFISLEKNGKTFTTYIYAYDLFKTHIVDDVIRKINNLIIEDSLNGGGD